MTPTINLDLIDESYFANVLSISTGLYISKTNSYDTYQTVMRKYLVFTALLFQVEDHYI